MAKGWLDNYGKEDNYNDSNVSAPEGFRGDGYSNVGRNYSPAWGGQFQMGGSLPGATGHMYARIGAPSNGKYAKHTLASAQEGISVSGKPVSKNDVRKEKDLIKILPSSSLYPEDEASYVRTTKSLKNLGKRDKKIEQEATDRFVDWYQDPETLKRFNSNTGMDSARLQDFVGKALRTPMRPAKDDDYLDSEDNAQWRSPFWQDQNYRTLNKDTGEILYNSDATVNTLQHELGHASNLDEVLGPKLMNILGKPANVFKAEKAYIGRPTEAYGNFHEFRTNLGLKPGQKIDTATLKKLTKKKGLDQERFYRAYDPDKITKAINTVAYNPDQDSSDTQTAKNGGWLDNYEEGGVIKDDMGQWAHPGEITEINSNDITMEGVSYNVLGISDIGDTKLMKPGKNYKFKGKKVTEYPMAKNGVNQQDGKSLQQLDQLTNFTNYNTKQPGGWLDNL